MIANALSSILPSRMSADYGPLSNFWYTPVGEPSTSGITIKPDNAMRVSAVFGCVRLLREVLGSLPFRVYRRTGDRTVEKAPDHPLWEVLHNRPNRWQTPMEWKEMGVAHLLLRGNFYCRQIVNPYGELELVPQNPDRVTVEQMTNRSLRYTYRPISGKPETYYQESMFHVRGLSLNGVTGVSVLEFARNAVGAAIAQETYGSSLFRNGGLPTFWISRPKPWAKDGVARKNFREGWRKLHAGPDNAGNPPILEDGMELHELGLTSRDSQWIESRGFGAKEICRFFGVDPVLIAEAAAGTLGTNEQIWMNFVTSALGPLACRWEQSANRDLVEDPDTYYTKIVMDALLRGDLLSRYQAHNIGIQGGQLLVNEARELEDRNPIEGGDIPRFPLNMQPAGGGPDQNEQGGQPGKGTPKPPKKKEAVATDDDEDDPTAYEKRKKARQESFGLLLEEAAQRIAAHEIKGLSDRADRAAEDRVKWKAWGGEFYGKHCEYATKVLDPICAAWLAETGNQITPADAAASLQEPADISELFDDDADVPKILEKWRGELAAWHANTLKTEFFR